MSGGREAIAAARTALFVPGDRPDRFERAAQSGADSMIVDLEDAVALDRKSAARSAALGWLATATPQRAVMLRINDGDDDDLNAVAALLFAAPHSLDAILVPKAESPAGLDRVASRLPAATPIVALIESAAGVAAAQTIASHPSVDRLAFGAVDFALDVDSTAEGILEYARAAIVIASRSARIAAPIDSPSLEIVDLDAVRASARHARELGFGGKLCIHPAQLAIVEQSFMPTPEQIADAKRIVAARMGAVAIDGRMVDRPVVERARRILLAAGQPR